jgi:conjugal transfer/entry exclusion protein
MKERNRLMKDLNKTEQIITLIQKETFDYTKWQESLFEDMTIEEIYNNAAKLRNDNKENRSQMENYDFMLGNEDDISDLEEAADALYDDYKSDESLTDFTTLDHEGFYEAR